MAESSSSIRVTEASSAEPLKFIMSNAHNANQVAHTCLMRCNEEENDYQSSAYYLSAIVALFPILEVAATSLISGLGYQVQKIDQAGFDNVGFNLLPPVEFPRLLTMVGQSIFALYRYFPDEFSYVQFMQNQTNLLKAEVRFRGPLLRGCSSDVIFTFAKARAVRKILQNFKAILLKTMLGLKSDPYRPLGEMCVYICCSLCCTDMYLYQFIGEALFQTRSPVLRDEMVREEVKNYAAARKAVSRSKYPQFFRILYPYEVTKVMDRSRFPTIAAVAQILRAERYCLPRPTNNSALVERLVSVHKAYMETYENNDPDFLFF